MRWGIPPHSCSWGELDSAGGGGQAPPPRSSQILASSDPLCGALSSTAGPLPPPGLRRTGPRPVSELGPRRGTRASRGRQPLCGSGPLADSLVKCRDTAWGQRAWVGHEEAGTTLAGPGAADETEPAPPSSAHRALKRPLGKSVSGGRVPGADGGSATLPVLGFRRRFSNRQGRGVSIGAGPSALSLAKPP